jgi:hypothetical protein
MINLSFLNILFPVNLTFLPNILFHPINLFLLTILMTTLSRPHPLPSSALTKTSLYLLYTPPMGVSFIFPLFLFSFSTCIITALCGFSITTFSSPLDALCFLSGHYEVRYLRHYVVSSFEVLCNLLHEHYAVPSFLFQGATLCSLSLRISIMTGYSCRVTRPLLTSHNLASFRNGDTCLFVTTFSLFFL